LKENGSVLIIYIEGDVRMAITRIWIEEGCTLCGLCEITCPDVFELGEDTALVKKDVDFDEYEEMIIEAAENCPASVIRYK
jgi:ferredoxin